MTTFGDMVYQMGGVPVGGVFTTGTVFFADSATGSNSNDGKKPSTAVATLDYAIGLCTADKGDIIYLMPGHAESIAAVAADVAGICVFGLGHGEAIPTFTGTTAGADMVDITADSVWFDNIKLVGGASGTTALVDCSAGADSCKFTRCHFMSGAAAPVDIVTMTGAHYVTFDGCFFEGDGTGLDNFILLEAACNFLTVKNCLFDAIESAGIDEAAIQFAASSTSTLIEGNTFISDTDGDVLVLTLSEHTGLIADNLICVADSTDVWGQITYENFAFANNSIAQPGSSHGGSMKTQWPAATPAA